MKRWIGLAAFFTLFAVVLFWPSRGIFAQSGHNITLSWSAPTTGGAVTSYNVKRSVSTGTEVTIATVPSTQTNYVDTTGVAGTKYFYVVSASNGAGESPNSNEGSATFLQDKPAAPGGLSVVAN